MVFVARSIWAGLTRDPLRSILTILSVSLGAAIITLTVSIGERFVAVSISDFSVPGLRMMAANAGLKDGRSLEYVRDPVFSIDDMVKIQQLAPSIKAISPISRSSIRTIESGGERYGARSALAVGSAYADVYGLRMVAGSFFSQADFDGAKNVLVISEAAANMLFGNAAAAVGKTLFEVSMHRGQNSQGDAEDVEEKTEYSIVGVFADAGQITRETYMIPDFLVPFTLLPPQKRALDRFAVLSDEPDAEIARAKIQAALRSLYGDDTKLTVWQGGAEYRGGGPDREAEVVQSIVLFLNSFGMIALLVSSVGVCTMMMVGIVERSRDIGLRRALGSPKNGVVFWLVGEAVATSGAGAVVGLGLAALFIAPVTQALSPILPGVGSPDGAIAASITPLAVLVGVSAALFAGVLLGIFPAVLSARTEPAESMRDN